MNELPSWLEPTWRDLLARLDHLPHGILLAGPPGVGKRMLADALAARLLCRAAEGSQPACGECSSCRLRQAGNHPDLRLLVPEASLAETQESAAERKGSKPSSQILIEQVRELHAALELSAHLGGRRCVVIDPAEAMNPYTANALLKLLEEPPRDTHLILVSAAPRRLLPTLRSRCQSWQLANPPLAEAQRWLAAHAPEASPDLLAVTGGSPLDAARLASRGGAYALGRFVSDLERLAGGGDAIELAARWESWTKGRDGGASGIDLPRLSDWLQRWVWDLVASKSGAPGRYFRERSASLEAIARVPSLPRLLDCYNEISQIRRRAGHPLNLRLALEDMLLRYQRGVDRENS